MTDKIQTINGKRYIGLDDYKSVVMEALNELKEKLIEIEDDIDITLDGVEELK